jgi:hypothetical protein
MTNPKPLPNLFPDGEKTDEASIPLMDEPGNAPGKLREFNAPRIKRAKRDRTKDWWEEE